MPSYHKDIHICPGYNCRLHHLSIHHFSERRKKYFFSLEITDPWMRQNFDLPFTTSHAMEVIFLRVETSKKPINNKASSSSSTIPRRKAG
jgi:hypothetical protein